MRATGRGQGITPDGALVRILCDSDKEISRSAALICKLNGETLGGRAIACGLRIRGVELGPGMGYSFLSFIVFFYITLENSDMCLNKNKKKNIDHSSI